MRKITHDVVFHTGTMLAVTVFSYTTVSKDKLSKRRVEYLFSMNDPEIPRCWKILSSTRKETSSEACHGSAWFQQNGDASCHQVFFFLQGKAPKEIRAILTETLACFLPGRAKDLPASLYMCPTIFIPKDVQHTDEYTVENWCKYTGVDGWYTVQVLVNKKNHRLY